MTSAFSSTGRLRAAFSVAAARPLLRLSFILLTVTYLYAAVSRSSVQPLWMDEVLAVSTARLPTLELIWSAIWKGAEFSPPTYHLLLHPLVEGNHGASSLLLARLPSIAAVYGAALCVYALLSRHVSHALALLAFGSVLAFELFDYAIQARQYALIALCVAGACLIWDGLANKAARRFSAALLWLVLSVAASLHFYGVVALGSIAVMEALWLISRREIRIPVWLAMIGAALVAASWYPLAAHLATFSGGDVFAPNYHGKPSVYRLVEAVFEVVVGGLWGALFLVATAGLIFCIEIARRTAWGAYLYERWRSGAEGLDQVTARGISRLEIIILGIASVPFTVFTMSLFATHSFSSRFISAASLLLSLSIAYALNKFPHRQIAAFALVPFLALAIFVQKGAEDPVKDSLTSIRAAEDEVPIVVGEGLLFIELMEAADPQTRARLFYLLSPPGTVSPDPTNENQVKRLKTIHPDLPVMRQQEFVAENPSFYLLHRNGISTDTTTPSLLEQGLTGPPISLNSPALIFKAGAERHSLQPHSPE